MASKKVLIQVDLQTKGVSISANNVVKSINQMEGAQAKLIATQKKGRAQSGLNNAILLETGRLASDASFGFTAIANNLSQVVTLFSSFAETNGGVVKSLEELGRSLWGVGGILIGVQLLISFGPKILDFFTGMDSAAKAAAKSTKDLAKSLDSLNANIVVAEEYLDLLDDTNLSEQERSNITKELIKLVPDLTEEDLKYGNNLDDVREKIKLFAIAQASRIEIDKLVEDNSELLSKRRRIDVINQIEDEEEKAKAIREFAEENDFNQKLVAGSFGVQGKLVEKSNEELSVSFQKRTKTVIDESNKIIDKINELTGTAFLGGKPDVDEEKNNKATESRISNFNKEISQIIKLGKIQNDFAKKRADLNSKEIKQEKLSFDERRSNLESEILQGQISIDLQEAQSLKELNQLEISEELKGQARLNIEKYYDDLRTKSTKENSEARTKIDNLERDAKLKTLDDIGRMIMSASDIAGKSTGAGKALAIAGTLVSTYSSAQKAYESQLTATPDSPFRAVIAAAAAVASGLANVAAIRKVKTPTMKESSISGVGGATAIEAPDFNVVGASGTSQLATSLAGVTGRPIQAFVVSKQITSQQELDRNITNNASIN
tara:strand:- start:210 stop:2027 length:1818 start_codon:yes stop_codon:yes gene_type:complete